MTGSMYAAIAGLQTHMQKMNVLGNNIANANTVGFKPGVTVFSESLYTAINNSTAGGNQYGGPSISLSHMAPFVQVSTDKIRA